MHTHGSDRVRQAGERVILLSAISKGWTPRTPKTLTHAEYPGTTVLWDEQYYEVVEATVPQSGGVRYVLIPWPESHTIRTLEHYDAESEALRIADHERVRKQQRSSIAARLTGIFLGYLPAPVQNRLEEELGVRATRMTLFSCIPPLVIFGWCMCLQVDATIGGGLSPVPVLLWPVMMFLLLETLIRFFVVMSQGRPMGSAIGLVGYFVYRGLSNKPGKLPPLLGNRGDSVAFIPPPEDVELRDSFTMIEPLLTLLAREDQVLLTARFGFDHRKHGFLVAGAILVFAGLGALTSFGEFDRTSSVTSLLSMLIAVAVAGEQALRLTALRRGPTPSVFAVLVRPLARKLLR